MDMISNSLSVLDAIVLLIFVVNDQLPNNQNQSDMCGGRDIYVIKWYIFDRVKRLSKFQMLKRNHPCVSAKAVTIEKNSMSRQKSLLCIDTIWSCKVAAKILLFIETKILPRD